MSAASLKHTDRHLNAEIKLIQPRGHIAVIGDPKALDVLLFKRKALTLSWEMMFTRSMYQTPDMMVQHQLLNQIADLLDEGALISTVNRHFGAMTVENLKAAHQFQESGTAIGKSVLDGIGQG